MSTLSEILSAEQIAAIAAMVGAADNNSDGVAENDAERRQSIPKEWKVGWEIIRHLNAKRFDPAKLVEIANLKTGNSEGIATFSHVFRQDGSLYETEDGASQVTFGDLKLVVEGGAINAKGVAVNDYPNVWRLSWPEAKFVRDFLRTAPDAGNAKPKASANGKPKASGKATNSATPNLADLERLIAAAVASQLASHGLNDDVQPAKPVPAAGHKIAKSATPTVSPEPSKTVLKPRDIVWVEINGEAVERQISDDGKRFNVTISR